METIQKQLTLIIAVSYSLIPITSFMLGLNFGIINSSLFFQSLSGIQLLVLSVLLCSLSIIYFKRFLKPVLQILARSGTHTLNTNLSEDRQKIEVIHQHLIRFTRLYWSYCLPFILLLPLSYQVSLGDPASTILSWQTLHLILLILIVSVLVALPGYLLSLTVIGKVSQHIGLENIQVSLKTKMLLVGGYIPLLATAVMLEYFSWRTGAISIEIVFVWALIACSAIISTLIVINSLKTSLQPLEHAFTKKSDSSHADLAKNMVPHSNDEIGLLLQTLGRLFTRLGEQESYVQAIVSHADEAIIVTEDCGKVVLFNPAAEILFGITAIEIGHYSLASRLPSIVNELACTLPIIDKMETTGIHHDGSSIPISVSVSELRMNDRICHTYLIQDLTNRKATESLLQDAEDRYRTLVETAHDLVWSMSIDGKWTYLNSAVIRIYGYEIAEMIGQSFTEFQATVSIEPDQKAHQKVLSGEEIVHYETIHLHKDGSQRFISFNAKPVYDANNNIVSITGTARDISKQKAYENELTYQSQHDTLTGLLNRRYFHQELTRVIARVSRSGMECALLYIDLDQFKYINDTLGHAAGDKLLVECTELLQKNTRNGDMLARFGGDEFTILLYNIAPSRAEAVAELLRKLFDEFRFYHSSQAYSVTCSIGLSIIDNGIATPDEALSRADLACNVAKTKGRNCVHISNKRDEEKMGMAADMGWAARVRDAYENDKFTLMYQPIYSLEYKQITDYEVLLRIPLNDGGMILPGGFIPAAERFGLIHHVDRWTVKHAILNLSELHQSGYHARFAINLSGRAFEDQELLPLISQLLKETGLDPQLLTFEITETQAIANLSSATTFICKLKDIGCQFALDDFGSGFCSFTYLKNLPVDILKIDGSFVQSLHKSEIDQAMVQSMNQIAHALGKKTIAEFVENVDTLNLLENYGVDFAQGYYFGKPQLDILSQIRNQNTLAVSEINSVVSH